MSFATELIRQLDLVAGLKPAPPLTSDPMSKAGTGARVKYITSARYGAPPATVAKFAGVSTKTVTGWQGGALPSIEHRRTIDAIYKRFLSINNRAKLEVARRRAGKRVAVSVLGLALRVVNTEGDFRYWKPSTRWWPRFIARWIAGDVAGLNNDWNNIISDWDYPEPWDAELINSVEIT